MTNSRKIFAALFLLVVAAACNNVTQPQQLNPGSFSADMQDALGTPIYFTSTTAVAISAPDYEVHVTDPATGNEFSLTGLQTGTVTSAQGAKVIYYDNKNGQYYYSDFGNCAITISSTTPTLEGSFTARLVCTAAIDSIRQVTSGSFNAKFQ